MSVPLKRNQRVCARGHLYFKSSDCPTCPECEKLKQPKEGLLSLLSSPARRALESKGIFSAKELSKYTKSDIMALHGVGPASLPVFLKALKAAGLKFKK